MHIENQSQHTLYSTTGFLIAEIGINHNGSITLAIEMMKAAKQAGCNAVKFQKRTPEICVPNSHWNNQRQTPWGNMSYIDYKRKIEFNLDEYNQIDQASKDIGIPWFASCWDEPSVDFICKYDVPFMKASSASLTDHRLLRKMRSTGLNLMISTGMSTLEEIEDAVSLVGKNNLLIAHTTSSYPCPPDKLNLNMIDTLQIKYPSVPIGYSGHESGIFGSFAAHVKGAKFIERHFTLDKTMWGTDQSSSIEPQEMKLLAEQIAFYNLAKGDGIKRVYEEELSARDKLRINNTVYYKQAHA